MEQTVWELLGIAPTNQKREIRKAYTAQVKKHHVEDSPEEFEKLHQAYLQAMEQRIEVNEVTGFSQEQENKKSKLSGLQDDELEKLHSGEKELEEQKSSEALLQDAERKEPTILEQLSLREGMLEDADSFERLQEVLDEQLLGDLETGEWDVETFNREFAFSCFERLREKIKDGGLRIFEPEEWGNLIYQAQDAYYGDAMKADEWRGGLSKIAEPHCKTLIQLQAYMVRHYDISEEICLELWENFEVTGRMAGYALDSYEPVLSEMQKKYPKLKEQKAGRIILWKKELLLLAQKWQYRGWMGQKPERLTDMTLTKSVPEISQEEWQETKQLLEQEIFLKERNRTPMLQWLIQNWTVGIVSPALTTQLYKIYEKYSTRPVVRKLQEALMQQMSWYQKLLDKAYQGTVYSMPKTELSELGKEQNFWECFLTTAFRFSTGDKENAAGDDAPCLSAYLKKCYRPSMRWWKTFIGYEEKTGKAGRPSLVIDCGEWMDAGTLKSVSVSSGSVDNNSENSNGAKEGAEDFSKIQITFALHHIEYCWIQQKVEAKNTPQIFYRILPFEQLCRLGESLEEISKFFLLLPITVMEEDKTEQAYGEILSRLKGLPLYEAAMPYLASCLVHQTDWEDLPKKPQKRIEDIYYSETERYCFRGILTTRKFMLAFKTPDGWEEIKLQNGESKEIRAIEDFAKRRKRMHSIVEKRQPPLPECTHTISLAGRSQREKAEAVFEALIQKRRSNGRSGSWETGTVFPKMQEFLDRWDDYHLGTDGTIVLRFGEKEEESVTVQSYMFAHSDWCMDGLLVPVQGEKRYAYRKREARLQRRVEEPFLICGYFALEWALPIPYGVGKSGTFYSYYDHRLHRADDFEGLIAEYIDLSALHQVEIYKGYRTVSKFTGELEYYNYHWYSREDDEVYYNYPFEWRRQISEEM